MLQRVSHRLLLPAMLIGGLLGPALADIRIAVMGPMTGAYASLGLQLRAGVEAAAADLNAKGGIDGQTIRVDVDDDGCKAEDAAAAANRAAGRDDVLVVGPICAAAAKAAGAVFAANGTIAISPAVTANDFTDARLGPTLFRLAARDDAQGVAAGTYLASTFPKSRIAILNDGSPYGKALADATRQAMNEAGVREARDEAYDSGEKTYSALAARLVDDAIDVVFIGGYQSDIALIIKALRAKRSSAIVMGGDALATSEFADAAGNQADGTLLTFFTDWRGAASAADVVTSLRSRGAEPQGFVLPAYAAVQVWAAARQAVGSNNAAEIAARITSQPTATVLGETAFDAKGDVKLPGFAVYRWSDGSFIPATGT